MKQIFLRTPILWAFMLLVIVSFLSSCFSQRAIKKTTTKMKDSEVQDLRSKTLVVILPASQYDYVDAYNEMIGSAWTLTPILAVKHSDFAAYTDVNKYAYLEIYGKSITRTSTSASGQPYGFSTTNTHYYLALTTRNISTSRKGKESIKTQILSQVVLYPEFKTTSLYLRSKNVTEKIYGASDFRNYTLPYVLSYLRYLQKDVENKLGRSWYIDYSNNAMLDQLKRDTLYVPDSLVHRFNIFTGKESLKKDNIFEEYKGIYKMVSTPELIDIIKKKQGKPVFLFEYILSSSEKHVGVLEVNSGTVVYRRIKGKYNIKEDDLRRILE